MMRLSLPPIGGFHYLVLYLFSLPTSEVLESFLESPLVYSYDRNVYLNVLFLVALIIIKITMFSGGLRSNFSQDTPNFRSILIG